MTSTDLTLRDLINRAYNDPVFDIKLRLQTADTPADLRRQVERGINWVIGQLVQHRKYKQGQTEDHRTVEVVSLLRALGIPAFHDVKIGGHTDISIEMKDDFLWIAEAKNWRGASWIFKGFRQLMTRYATGLAGQDHGAILIYIEEENAAGLLAKWRSALMRRTNLIKAATSIQNLRFDSDHLHRGTGTPFHVAHLAVPLYWNPEDD